MIPIPQREHKLLLAIHGWSGVILGLLLLVILATGTVAVMGEEIGHWSSGSVEIRSPLTQSVEATVKSLLSSAPLDLRETLDLSATADNRLAVLFRGKPGPDEHGLLFDVAPDGHVLHRLEGLTSDIRGGEPAGALSSFLIGVHVRLYVPAPWGYMLTGIAGIAMMVASLSGFFIHRHLVVDAFTLRRSARPAIAHRDRHGVAAAWALPFVFLLGLTGSFLSFAGSVGIPALSWVSFGGDQQKLIAVLVGAPPASDPRPMVGADLDGIIADAIARTGIEPALVSVQNPGRADARVTITHETRGGELSPLRLVYDGAKGTFLQEKPSIGSVPSAGSAAFDLMVPLHFGNFAGLLSKVAWVSLGFAACFVTLSGLRLWLARRDVKLLTWMILDRATSVVAFGLPLAMGTAAFTYFATLSSGSTVIATRIGFLVGVVSSGLAAFVFARPRLDFVLRLGAGFVLAMLPLTRLSYGGPSWNSAMARGQAIIVVGDVAIGLFGLAFLAAPFAAWFRSRQAGIVFKHRHPAE